MNVSRPIIAVLRGGPSSEYHVSLESGANVLKNIPEDKYEARDIFISKNGDWHSDGVVKPPEQILRHVDGVFNALHGEYGEDGQVQELLDLLGVPYTGPEKYPAILAMNKHHSKNLVKNEIKTPWHIVVPTSEIDEDFILHLFRKVPHPCVIKPVDLGSSVGLTLAKNFFDFENTLNEIRDLTEQVLIEEYIQGKEATCGVIDNFRGQNVYAFPPVEIRLPKNKELFDYEAKYSGETTEICPGHFSDLEKEQIMDLASRIHKEVGLRHYSRSDFIIHPRRGIYFLEINSLPGLTKNSLLPKSIEAVGSSMSEFLDHVITMSLAS